MIGTVTTHNYRNFKELTLEAKVLEVVSLCVGDVTGLLAHVLGRQLESGLPGGHRSPVLGSDLLQRSPNAHQAEGVVRERCRHSAHRG